MIAVAVDIAEAITMAETEVYLEKLSAFSRMLRLEGLPIGPRETEDAAKLLTCIGFADRQQVKIALRTVFAKSREEQLAFDKVFDGFFITEEAMKRQAQEQMQREAEEAAIRQQAQEQFKVGDQPMDNGRPMPPCRRKNGSGWKNSWIAIRVMRSEIPSSMANLSIPCLPKAFWSSRC